MKKNVSIMFQCIINKTMRDIYNIVPYKIDKTILNYFMKYFYEI